MPGTNSFYPYGESSTNILNNSEYQTDSERSSGAQSGAIARSKMYNKQARQAAAGAYAVGALVAKSGKNADDSSAATLATNFQAAVSYQSAHFVASAAEISGSTVTATVAELATTAEDDLPALFALSLSLSGPLPAGASVAIASSLPSVTLSWPIYVGSEVLDSDTITGGAITLLIDTVGAKAFFKAGGGSKIPNDLPPLNPNFTLERSEDGTKIIAKADKLLASPETAMLAGGVWVLKSSLPHAPDDGTVKEWSRADLITTGKPYDGLYLGDVTASDANTEVLLWLPENNAGNVELVPFVILSKDYLGGVPVVRQRGYGANGTGWGDSITGGYDGKACDQWMENTYLNSILREDVASQIIEADWPTLLSSGTVGTLKRRAIALSTTELGNTASIGTAVEGTAFPYFANNTRRMAYADSGPLTSYLTRSASTTFGQFFFVNMQGGINGATTSDVGNTGMLNRPAFVLPKDFKIQQRPDGSYTVWNDMGLLTLGDIEASTDVSLTKINIGQTNGLKVVRYLSNRYADNSGALLEYQDSVGTSTFGSSTYSSSTLRTNVVNYCTTYLPDSLKALVQNTNFMASAGGSSVSVTDKFFVLSLNDYAGDPFTTSLNNRTYTGQGQQIESLSTEENRKHSVQITTRQIDTTGNYPGVIQVSGAPYYNYNGTSNAQDYCPAFMLPLTAPIRALADGTYDLVPEDPALSAQANTLEATPRAAGDVLQLKEVPASTAESKVVVKVPEKNGQSVNYIALRLGYGGVTNAYALMREDTLNEQVAFNSTPSPYGPQTPTAYENGTLDQYLTSIFKEALGVGVSDYLVDVPVQLGSASYTITRSIFSVSAYEMGSNVSGRPIEGTPFDYFSVVGNRGANDAYSSRTVVNTGATYFQFYVATNGSGATISQSAVEYPRPIICLDADAYVTDNGDGTYTFAGSNPNEITIEWEVAWDADTPAYVRQYTYNYKGQYQTMLQGAVASTEDEPIPTFELPEFTGNHAIFGDEISGRIELYESGTLTLSPGTYDIFLVGGGSGGHSKWSSASVNELSGGGGGGGYTKTYTGVEITVTQSQIPVVVGAGGGADGNGSQSAVTIESVDYTANGSIVDSYGSNGADGGSGGGGAGSLNNRAGAGGSDGGNGAGGNGNNYGNGQGTTTRAFGEAAGTLYAGGGGGGQRNSDFGVTSGGQGGGGNGSSGIRAQATSGAANTGGGGGGGAGSTLGAAGGSGLIIIRWNNA